MSKYPRYVNPNTTSKDVKAILLYALVVCSVLLSVALVAPWLPSLGSGSPLRLLLPILAACVGITLVAAAHRREMEEETEEVAPFTEEEVYYRGLVYGEGE